MTDVFLPGVPVDHVMRRLAAAGGNEILSGKLAHADSSAALAVNVFGWFVERPQLLPQLPGTGASGSAESVDVEYCARFPWTGGRHPWLDAAVFTATHLIGIESKRYEPFRDVGKGSLSSAYDRPVWGDHTHRYGRVRDALRSGELRFEHLDAAQLIKHAYGLVTGGRRFGKSPALFYIFAEPGHRAGKHISPLEHARHRDEISSFSSAVAGDEVAFLSASYREWLETWVGDQYLVGHADAIGRTFAL